MRCLLPQAPATGEGDTCETVGVVAPAVQMVTAFQAGQALKILTGHRDEVARGIYIIDVWSDDYGLRMEQIRPLPGLRDLPAGRVSGAGSDRDAGGEAVRTQRRPGASACRGDHRPRPAGTGTFAGTAEDVEVTPHLLRFRVEGCRFSVFPGGRALLFGTDETERARILYDRYVGA